MTGHKRLLERTNNGCYFSDCGCGWAGGVYRDRATATEAHAAHTRGGVSTVGKMTTTFLPYPRIEGQRT